MKTIPITRGLRVLVDDEDYAALSVFKWCAHRGDETHLYAARRLPKAEGGKLVFMHRLIAGAGPGVVVDHIDGDSLNNTRKNLRVCTPTENSRNRRKGAMPTGSRFKGVFRDAARTRWRAGIKTDGRTVYLGTFETEEEAARAYDEAAPRFHGAFARGNL